MNEVDWFQPLVICGAQTDHLTVLMRMPKNDAAMSRTRKMMAILRPRFVRKSPDDSGGGLWPMSDISM